MATYLPGVTESHQPTPLFTPDFTFLSQVLGSKQAKYDQGFAQVKNMYSSLLNSPVSSPEQEAFRREAFKKIETQIKHISTLDLSKPQSISKAQSVFDPLVNDRELLYDMSLTAHNHKALATGEDYKNSLDTDTRAKYSDTAKNYVLNSLEVARNSKRGDGSIFQAEKRDWVPFEDTHKYLQDQAEKQHLEIKQDNTRGLYIVSTTGGPNAAPAYGMWAQQTLGNRFDSQFKVEAVVKRENAVNTLMGQGYSKADATQQVANVMLKPEVLASMKAVSADASMKLSDIEAGIGRFERAYPNGIPESKAQEFQNLLNSRKTHAEFVRTSGKDLDHVTKSTSDQMSQSIDYYNMNAIKTNKALQWGKNYAMTTFKETLRADDVQLAFVKMKHAEKMADKRWQNDLQLAGIKRNWELEDKANEINADGTPKYKSISEVGMFTPEQKGGAIDVLNTQIDQNFESIVNGVFGDEGVLSYVLPSKDDPAAAKYSGMINKFKRAANGEQVTYGTDDLALLNDLRNRLGIAGSKDISLSSDPGAAKTSLLALVEAIKGKMTTMVASDPTGKAVTNLGKHISAFNQVQAGLVNMSNELYRIQDSQDKIASTILDSEGNVRESFEGIKVVRYENGRPRFDFTDATPAQRELLGKMLPKEYTDMAGQAGKIYSMKGLPSALLFNSLNPNGVEGIMVDGKQMSIEDAREWMPNLSDVELRKYFDNEATVKVNPQTGKVEIEYKASQSSTLTTNDRSGVAGMISGEGNKPRNIRVTMDYNKFIQTLDPKDASKFGGGSVKFTTSAFSELARGEKTFVKGDAMSAGLGFDYNITWGFDKQGTEGIHVSYTQKFPGQPPVPDHAFFPIKNKSPHELKEVEDSLQLLIIRFKEKAANEESNQTKGQQLIPYSSFQNATGSTI